MTKAPIIQHDPLAMFDEEDSDTLLPVSEASTEVGPVEEMALVGQGDNTSETTSDIDSRDNEMIDKNTMELHLEEHLTIQSAADLYEKMKLLFESDSAIEINASDVEMVDGAGLQLLAAFFKEAATCHLDINWKGTTGTLLNAAETVGMTELLGLKS